LRQHDLGVVAGEMHGDDLAYLTGRGCPVACLVQCDGVGHWVVVCHADGRQVRYQDPATGPQSVGWSQWLAGWRDVDRLGAVYRQWGVAAWR
jgi:ABC-type bacteriocin/lantibiotic exporter with double-glycine peptidase domain